MALNPPAGSQHIVPYIYYDDPARAVEFLCEVFGFEQTMLLERPNGDVVHAEVSMNAERVLIGEADQQFGLSSPQSLDAIHVVLCVYVRDVDAHYEHARASGATVVREITDAFYGARIYSARDPEGNLWEFREQRSDPSEDDLRESIAELARVVGR